MTELKRKIDYLVLCHFGLRPRYGIENLGFADWLSLVGERPGTFMFIFEDLRIDVIAYNYVGMAK